MGAPPQAVTREIDHLHSALEQQLPARDDHNLLVGSWNIRAFGDLTEKWNVDAGDSPMRDWHAVAIIAEILSQFDVVAVQEVRRSTTALQFLMEQLGPQWGFIVSDVTEGDAGNGERLAYIYNGDRVSPSGLVGEITLPDAMDNPVRQFARSPYAASFKRGEVEFILTTVHILWGSNAASRLPEITSFATWMRDWADRKGDWNTNLLVLGDFNIDRIDDPLYQAFISTGLYPPGELSKVPRTIFDGDKKKHFYDQIAWFTDFRHEPVTDMLQGMHYDGKAGTFDFVPEVFPGLTKNQLSWRVSDHYPLWVEFRTD